MMRRSTDTQHSFAALVLAALALVAGIAVVVDNVWARRYVARSGPVLLTHVIDDADKGGPGLPGEVPGLSS